MRSKSHQEVFEFAMTRLLDIVPGDFTPKEITPEHIIRYIKLIMNIVITNATLITYLNYLKAFFNYLVEEGYILKSPERKKRFTKKSKENYHNFSKGNA